MTSVNVQVTLPCWILLFTPAIPPPQFDATPTIGGNAITITNPNNAPSLIARLMLVSLICSDVYLLLLSLVQFGLASSAV